LYVYKILITDLIIYFPARQYSCSALIVETPIPKAKRSGIGKLNNPAQRRVMRLKLQKRSEWKFVSRIIPHKQVFNATQLAAESVSKVCFGVHTRDLFLPT
jgi:hypothetical protein